MIKGYKEQPHPATCFLLIEASLGHQYIHGPYDSIEHAEQNTNDQYEYIAILGPLPYAMLYKEDLTSQTTSTVSEATD